MSRIFKFLKELDWLMLILTLVLISIGWLLIYSATWGRTEGQDLGKIKIQVIATLIGLVVFGVMAALDFRLWESMIPVIYIFTLAILILVLFFGETIRGSTSWLRFGSLQFQPSELAKVLMLLVMAKYFSVYQEKIRQHWKHFLWSLVLLALPAGLVVLQSDLGTASIFAGVWFVLALAIKVPKKKLLFVVIITLIAVVLSWLFLLKPYQKDRLTVFLAPESDPRGAGYNILQSLIAVGSGNILGRGLGHGPQSQLNFLPEQHTDFIFAVLAEELGLVGGIILLAIFGFLFWRLIITTDLAVNDFGQLFVLALIFLIFLQVLVNIGMNIGIMPVTGIPLPFISYGGSAMISYLLAMGIAQSVYIRRRRM